MLLGGGNVQVEFCATDTIQLAIGQEASRFKNLCEEGEQVDDYQSNYTRARTHTCSFTRKGVTFPIVLPRNENLRLKPPGELMGRYSATQELSFSSAKYMSYELLTMSLLGF